MDTPTVGPYQGATRIVVERVERVTGGVVLHCQQYGVPDDGEPIELGPGTIALDAKEWKVCQQSSDEALRRILTGDPSFAFTASNLRIYG